jgi:hypothetical protein
VKKIIILILVSALVIGAIYYIRLFHRETGAEPVRQPALALLNKAGGADKVCLEADQMFKAYGASNLTMFLPSDLRNYPAIASLGTVDGIWPGHPAYIQIRVGNLHLDGYRIEIIYTNNSEGYVTSSNLIDLARSRIYVRR